MSELIYGSGGGGKGGGGGRVAQEAPNTLKSTQKAEIVDVISEGEIVGLVDGVNSIYVDDVPLSEYAGYSYEFRSGTQDQPAVSTSTRGTLNPMTRPSTYIKYGVEEAVFITIENTLVKTVVLQITVPVLSYQDATTGDLNGSYTSFKISTKGVGTGYTTKVDTEIRGKCTSPYKQDYAISLTDYPDANYPITIRLERTKPDADKVNDNDRFYCALYTEIQPTILRYPNTALINLVLDSDNFNSVPTRGYDVKGLKIKVPTNYNPENRVYSGEWDGTFKTAWSDNPAWVFYDLATEPRYGLGDNLSEQQIDKWYLYTIAKYCDELVPSGFKNSDGSIQYEPRFTCNIYLQSQQEAYKTLSDIASIFRGMQYWAAGQLMISADMPKDPIAQFSPSNVIDGIFNYSGSSSKTRHTAVKVTWNDPRDGYKQKIEYVEANGFSTGYNPIDVHGVIQTEVIAIGCSSRGQANRVGRWLLYSELLETEVVTFKTGIEAAKVYPGAVIQTTDPFRGGERLGGRILDTDSTGIFLDGEVTDGHPYYVSIVNPEPKISINASISGNILNVTSAGSGNSGKLTVGTKISDGSSILPNTYISGYITGSGGVGSYYVNNAHNISQVVLTATLVNPAIETRQGRVSANKFIMDVFSPPFSFNPEKNMVWVLSKPAQEPEYWRVVGITEEDSVTASITALEYNPDKFAAIEEGLILEERPVSQIDHSRPAKPENLNIVEHLYYSSPGVYSTAADVSWTSNQFKYVVKYCKIVNGSPDFNWHIYQSFTPNVTLRPIEPGLYRFELEAINVLGRKSEILSQDITILGVMAPPMNVVGFKAAKELGIELSWVSNQDARWEYPDIDLDGYEIRELYTTELSGYLKPANTSEFPLWVTHTYYHINDVVKRIVGSDTLYYICIENHDSSTSFDSTNWTTFTYDIRWLTLQEMKIYLNDYSISFNSYVSLLNTVWDSYAGNKAESGLIYETSYKDFSASLGYNVYLIKAVDKSGNYSVIPSITGVEIDRPSTPTNIHFNISGDNLEIYWDQPNTDLTIKNYVISYYDNSGQKIEFITETTYASRNLWFSDFTEYLELTAYDVSGNSSETVVIEIHVGKVPAPNNLTYNFIGENYEIKWQAPVYHEALLPNLKAYEIRTNTSPGSQDGLITTLNATSYSSKVNWGGPKTIYVYTIDSVGNYGEYASITIDSPIPSKPTNILVTVVDNNVLFQWDAPSSGLGLPIMEYILKRGSDWLTADLVGTKSGEFTTVFETLSGDYTYWLAAINSAGTVGTPDKITATVNQPPDYVLVDNYHSTFDDPYGDTTNNPASYINSDKIHKSLSGALLIPIDPTQTWGSHFTSNSKTTIQGFVDSGWTRYIEPSNVSGFYEELIDYGALIAASTVSVTLTKTVLSGNPNIVFSIQAGSGNPNSIVWHTVAKGDRAYFTNFRYLKIRVAISNGIIELSDFNVKLDVKKKSKSGNLVVKVPEASFTGNINGNILTVNTISSGSEIRIDQTISGANIAGNTIITGKLTGNGGIGTYTINNSQTVTETSMTSMDLGGAIVYITDTGSADGNRLFTDVQSINLSPNWADGSIPVAIYNFVDSATPTYFKILLFDSNTGARIGGTCSYTVTGV